MREYSILCPMIVKPVASRPDIQQRQVKVKICLTKEFFKKKMLLDEVTLNQSKGSVSKPLFFGGKIDIFDKSGKNQA
jgi:hypothetical protein